MNSFKVASFQLIESKKWVPAGTLFTFPGDPSTVQIQQVEFNPKFRFDTKNEADQFFKNHYMQKGFTENPKTNNNAEKKS